MIDKINIFKKALLILIIIRSGFVLSQDLSSLKFVPPKIELIDNDSILLIEIKEKNKNTSNDSTFYIDDTELFVNFPKGEKALIKYIKKNLHYPDSAVKARIEGNVFVSFVVDESGKISDIKITKGLNPIIDNEVIRMISNMPNWVWDKRIKLKARKRIKKMLPIKFEL